MPHVLVRCAIANAQRPRSLVRTRTLGRVTCGALVEWTVQGFHCPADHRDQMADQRWQIRVVELLGQQPGVHRLAHASNDGDQQTGWQVRTDRADCLTGGEDLFDPRHDGLFQVLLCLLQDGIPRHCNPVPDQRSQLREGARVVISWR
jgi:hypothetical protein